MRNAINFKAVSFFILLSIAMTAYIGLMGKSANKASAESMYDFTEAALGNWHKISSTLNIPLINTKPSMLQPVVKEGFGALDLVIYGHEIVEEEYRSYYQKLDMPRMVGQLFIPNGEQGELRYMVGGIQLISIQAGSENAAFFMDVPKQIINEASLIYDGVALSGDRDGTGVVRYEKLNDGRYVMGLFLSPIHNT